MRKVIIGIVSKHKKVETLRIESLVRDEVKQAIFDNGGIAIGILSPNDNILYCGDNWRKFENEILKDDIISQIDLCDGIILQGGVTNEAYESFIANYCYVNDIPILGICAGQNNIVRALGGTTCKISNPLDHYKMHDDYVHSIEIDRESNFYSIIGKEKIMVNSRHKRTILNSPQLEKVAFCEDGYADVVEAKDKSFYIGVKFHPESLYKFDENMNNIFKCFIDECKKNILSKNLKK